MYGRSALFLALLVGIPVAIYFLVPQSSRVDHLAVARDAITRRDFATARRELDAHLAENPRDTEAQFLAARTARRDGDGVAAEKYLQAYLEIGGDREAANLEREMRRSQEGDVSSAGGVLKFCTEHPDHAAAPFMLEALARGLLAAGDSLHALTALDLWLSRAPPAADRVQALVWRGTALERLGRVPEAAADYRKALEIDPAHAEARLRLASFLTRDEPQEALNLYERLEHENPGQFEVLLGLARCHRQLGDHDAAGRIIARLQADRPDDVGVLTEAGMLALDRGHPADAEPLLRRAVALAPTRRDPNLQLLRCLRDQGKESEASEQQAKFKRIEEELQRKIDAATRKP